MLIEPYLMEMNLENLTQSGPNYNFRCPVCGDSSKDPNKKRGWFKLSKNGVYYFTCYNDCTEFLAFITFLRLYYPSVLKKYKKDHAHEIIRHRKQRTHRIQNGNEKESISSESRENIPDRCSNTENDRGCSLDKESECDDINHGIGDNKLIYGESFSSFTNNTFTINKTENCLLEINEMNPDHEAYKYIKNRLIPDSAELYYTKSYMHLCNSIKPNSFSISPRYDERIVIPFRDENGVLFGLQGRAIDKNNDLRYLTCMFSDHNKIFGLDKVNFNETVYVLEGPIDSLFVPNALAIAGADFDASMLLKYADQDKFIFWYDPETRNSELIDTMMKRLNEGFKICIMPESIRKYGKDVNQWIENGLSIEEIMKIANENIVSGINGKVRLNIWRKIYLKKKNKY